jgi:hypothetical protein
MTAHDDGWNPTPGSQPAPQQDRLQQPVLRFANPGAWVEGYLAPHIARRLGGRTTWCRQWFRHTEAVSRITALWLAWEHLRKDGATGLSHWWVHHADHHLKILMSVDDGPFSSCDPDHHRPQPPLPCDPADERMWASPIFSRTS